MDPIVGPEEPGELEAALMSAGRDVRMSPELRNKTLAALGVGVAVGVTTTTTAQASVLGWLSGKTGALVVATGFVGALGVAGAVALLGAPSEPDEAAEPAPLVVERAPGGVAGESEARPAEETSRQSDGPPSEALEPPAAAREVAAVEQAAVTEREESEKRPAQRDPAKEPSTLREELSHIARVEAALQEKQPGRALGLLSEYRRRFPRPQLGLEAELLTIQALSEDGSIASARARAARFVEKYPNSPLRARAKRYLE